MIKNETSKKVVLWAFYGGSALLLIAVVSGFLAATLPAAISSRIGYNSESYLFAFILGAWIQFAMPRLPGRRRMQWALGVGGLFAAIGVFLILTDLPSRLRTLNEPALALALLLPYVSLERRFARPLLWVIPAILIATVWSVIWAPGSWIIDQAETAGFLVLGMLTLDVFDRRLLDQGAPVNRPVRWAWYGFLLLEPIVVSALGTTIRSGDDPLGLALRYLGRIHESFVGVLLLASILHLVTDYRLRLRQSA